MRTLVHTEYFFEPLHYCTVTLLQLSFFTSPSENTKVSASSTHERHRAQSLNA